MDSVIKVFFDYFKESGFYEKFIIVIYGDYYGIFNFCNFDFVFLIGKIFENWLNYDNVML